MEGKWERKLKKKSSKKARVIVKEISRRRKEFTRNWTPSFRMWQATFPIHHWSFNTFFSFLSPHNGYSQTTQLKGFDILRGFIRQSSSSSTIVFLVPQLESIYSLLSRYLTQFRDQMGGRRKDSPEFEKPGASVERESDGSRKEDLRKMRRLFSDILIRKYMATAR